MAQYEGGKNQAGIYQRIINQIPPHEIKIEGFYGSGAITRLMKLAPIANIGIEIDEKVVAMHQADPNEAITIIHGDAISLLRSWKLRWRGLRVFVYLDAPYLRSVRSYQEDKLYRKEFDTPEQHAQLLELAKELPWPVMINHPQCDQYNQALSEWRQIPYVYYDQNHNPKPDCLWMNYPEPFELHDTRYIGRDYRERERIKKKANRWVRMLLEQHPQERYAIISKIDELRGGADR